MPSAINDNGTAAWLTSFQRLREDVRQESSVWPQPVAARIGATTGWGGIALAAEDDSDQDGAMARHLTEKVTSVQGIRASNTGTHEATGSMLLPA